MKRLHFCIAAVFVFAAVIGSPVQCLSQGSIYEFSTESRSTRLWIPPGLDTIRGIFIYGNGAGGDSRDEVYLPWNQAFAYNHGFAMIATSMWGNLSGNEINIWDSHLAGLAGLSGHPELINAPWAPIGFSNGGQMSYGFNALRPDKTIAFVTNKGCCYNIAVPSATARSTPGVLIAGELDTDLRRSNIKSLFSSNRPRGAHWAWVEQQGEAHSGRADAMILPFMSEAIRLRYPEDQLPSATQGVTLKSVSDASGWLADQASWKSGLTKIAAYDEYLGNKSTAGWLLNENVAFVYRAFSTYDRKATLTFDLNFPFELEAWVGLAGDPLSLDIDLTADTEWSRFTLYDYSTPVLQVSKESGLQDLLSLEVPGPRKGTHAYSALITYADGSVSTTNPLAYFAVVIPEPGGLMLLSVLATFGLVCRQGT